MHKGVILLVKADDRDEAIEKVNAFMEPHGNGDVWDWYVIGGRWSGELNQKNKEFTEKAKVLFSEHEEEKLGGLVSVGVVEKLQPELQRIWESIGGEGQNPYGRDNYQQDGSDDDVMKLSDCLDVVKSWSFDIDQRAKEQFERAEKHWANDRRMKGYCIKKAGMIMSEEFCSDANVYNTEMWDYSIPEDTTGWFACIVDMHN